MTNRSPITVLLLSCFIPFYSLYWMVVTKNEMNATHQTAIPTAWFIIIPIANIIWFWKWSSGVEKATNGGLGGAVVFLLMLALGPIGSFVVQGKLNDAGAAPAA